MSSENGTGTTPVVHKIVVGVDGSEGSIEALRWAAQEAELRGAELLVILAWQLPTASPYMVAVPIDVPEWEAGSLQALDETLTAVFGGKQPDWVHGELREGPASRVLVEASRDADLLVVGSRGHGGFVGALLGSVSTAIVHHATCPVFVVRPRPAASHKSQSE